MDRIASCGLHWEQAQRSVRELIDRLGQSIYKVALVAPVHNRRETTLQALRSLGRIRSEGLDLKLIIVDDGSADGTGDAIRARFPEVEIISGDGTLHYAAGTNRGVELALKWDPDFVITMNDDSIFHDEFLLRMVDTAIANPRCVIGALLLLWDQPHKVFQVAPKWNAFRGGWIIPDDLTAFTVPAQAFEVECIVGNCVLFPVDAIRNVGLMDEGSFRFGWGDAQWLSRMRKAGWKLLIQPKALVWCEPNTNTVPLHALSLRNILKTLFVNERHPLNLKRQFDARWHSAPTRVAAVLSFFAFIFILAGKAFRYAIARLG